MLEGKGNYGFDAARKQRVDLLEAGIIDPTKVVRIALENAVSVASVLLLSEATMTEIEEPKHERNQISLPSEALGACLRRSRPKKLASTQNRRRRCDANSRTEGTIVRKKPTD
jgi:hypothetical protein